MARMNWALAATSLCQILLVSSGVVFVLMFAFRNQFAGWLGLETHWMLWAVFLSMVSVVFQLRLGQWQANRRGSTELCRSRKVW